MKYWITIWYPITGYLERISLKFCVRSRNLHLNGDALVTHELVLCRSPCVCRTAALILLFKNKNQIVHRLVFLSFLLVLHLLIRLTSLELILIYTDGYKGKKGKIGSLISVQWELQNWKLQITVIYNKPRTIFNTDTTLKYHKGLPSLLGGDGLACHGTDPLRAKGSFEQAETTLDNFYNYFNFWYLVL